MSDRVGEIFDHKSKAGENFCECDARAAGGPAHLSSWLMRGPIRQEMGTTMKTYINDNGLAQTFPIVSGLQMLKAGSGASLYILHVQCKLLGGFWGLRKEVEKGSVSTSGYVESCLVFLVSSTPLLGCLRKSRCGRHRVLGHEVDPIRKSGVRDEKARDRIVGNAMESRLR